MLFQIKQVMFLLDMTDVRIFLTVFYFTYLIYLTYKLKNIFLDIHNNLLK